MQDLAGMRQKVEQEIRALLTGGSTPLFGLDAMNLYHLGFADCEGKLLDASKGKYLRPLFCLAITAGLNGDVEKALPAAASLELAHRTSLIFDDIQDVGKERNGQPTMWMVWGENQAINAGLALSCCARLAVQRGEARGVHPVTMLRTLNVLESAVIDLCRGQYLDISFMERMDVTVEDYLRMIRGKTGALFGAACEVGAICAGRVLDKATLAREFGLHMGMAFQMQDDYLGIWGDEVEVGKTANDLTEKKRSLPVVLALQKDPELMGCWLQIKDVMPDDVETIKAWMENKGIHTATQQMAMDQVVAAREELRELELSPEWYHEINQFLAFVVDRKQ